MTMGTGKYIEYAKIISENPEKGEQVILALEDFKGTSYIQLRKYYMSFDEGWQPTKVGITVPATIANIYGLLDGLLDMCAQQEATEIINHYKAKIDGK